VTTAPPGYERPTDHASAPPPEPPPPGQERLLAKAMERASAVVVPTRVGGVETPRVDAEWLLPPPAINRAGSEHVVTTRIFRHTDRQPLANYRATFRSIAVLNHPDGGGIGARHFTVSTSGLAPQVERDRQQLQQAACRALGGEALTARSLHVQRCQRFVDAVRLGAHIGQFVVGQLRQHLEVKRQGLRSLLGHGSVLPRVGAGLRELLGLVRGGLAQLGRERDLVRIVETGAPALDDRLARGKRTAACAREIGTSLATIPLSLPRFLNASTSRRIGGSALSYRSARTVAMIAS